ncbi:MAG: M48 family metalloprotease [Xanthomonadaceae bacterium]|nr:M48 family metalloprotease [Xanthomonadaceae bacterium]
MKSRMFPLSAPLPLALATVALSLSGVLLAATPAKHGKPAKPAAAAVPAGPTTAPMQPTQATIVKPEVQAHAKPDFASPALATLAQNSQVTINGQQGLWFRLDLGGGKSGYVRVNEVRVAFGSKDTGGMGKALFSGNAGKGRVTETASVRGLDESSLKAAAFNPEQLQKMESYRASPEAAEQAASKNGWQITEVAYAEEYQPAASKPKKKGLFGKAKPESEASTSTQAEKRERYGIARNLLGFVNPSLAATAAPGEKLIGKSEQEVDQEELDLGPMLAGRLLGAAPLVKDAAVQTRVNLIGRWVASRTSRPNLPWTFGVIEDDEINAFAAPGGYILITRGLYQLLGSDTEVAGVLGHEIGHVVQRDHYEVIRKQEKMGAVGAIASSQVKTGGGMAGGLARNYIEKHGAAILMTGLDRGAEFRADHAAGIYVARAGGNPLSFLAVLQKMAAFGTQSPKMASLYKTHPPLDERMNAVEKQDNATLAAYLNR